MHPGKSPAHVPAGWMLPGHQGRIHVNGADGDGDGEGKAVLSKIIRPFSSKPLSFFLKPVFQAQTTLSEIRFPFSAVQVLGLPH